MARGTVAIALAMAVSGCRTLHENQLRERLFQTRLALAELPLSLDEAQQRLAEHRPGVIDTCAPCLTSTRETAGGREFCLLVGRSTGCVEFKEVGPRRISATSMDVLPLPVAKELWRVLDPEGMAGAQVGSEDDVSALAIEEEASFQPRSTFFAWAWTSVVATQAQTQPVFGFGAAAGVRRWLGYFLLGGLGATYEALLTLTQLNVLGVQGRAELSLWSEQNRTRLSLPGTALSMTVTPLIALGGGRTAPGLRAALGLHLTHLGRTWAPIHFEVGYQAIRGDSLAVSGFRIALGVGF